MEYLVSVFTEKTEDASFKEWLAQHKQGFYLNETQQGNIKSGVGGTILHEVGCHHLGDGQTVSTTTYAKAASDSRDALMGWAQGKNLMVAACNSCKPDK